MPLEKTGDVDFRRSMGAIGSPPRCDNGEINGHAESALHWAAHEGLARLAGELIARGADVNLRDREYDGTPLEWALHGYVNAREDSARRHREVVALLVAARAPVDPKWLEHPRVRADREMLEALTSRDSRPKA